MTTKLAYYSFRYLFNSVDALKRDLDLTNIKLSERIAILTLVAFTYESFLNHVGGQVFTVWGEHMKKKLSPDGKLALFCEIGNIKPDFGASPFQSFKAVMVLRNKLAHAETEYLSYDDNSQTSPELWPRPDWLTAAENLDLNRVISDLEVIMKTLGDSLKIPPVPNFIYMEAVNI